MARRYHGDINGKFWNIVQASNDASFFGGVESEPCYIEYAYTEDDLQDIECGLNKCRTFLGEYKQKLDAYFGKKTSYDNTQIASCLGIGINEKEGKDIDEQTLNEILSWYARLQLGEKIRKCVEETGECNFEAELYAALNKVAYIKKIG